MLDQKKAGWERRRRNFMERGGDVNDASWPDEVFRRPLSARSGRWAAHAPMIASKVIYDALYRLQRPQTLSTIAALDQVTTNCPSIYSHKNHWLGPYLNGSRTLSLRSHLDIYIQLIPGRGTIPASVAS